MAEGYDLTLTPTGVLTDSGNELWRCAGRLAGRVYLEEATIANRGTGLWRAVPHAAAVVAADPVAAETALIEAIIAAREVNRRQARELTIIPVAAP